jgi:hypothetical protein
MPTPALKSPLSSRALQTGRARTWVSSETAKVIIYEAFVEGRLEAPKHLARSVHDLYFEPKYEEFQPRTIWSLANAFTSAFKELDPIAQFKATAKLAEFLEARFSQSFYLAGGRGRDAPLTSIVAGCQRCRP